VLANPQDIHRYTAEFFALAKSVRAAQKTGGNAGAASFEQLVELGKTNKQLDANDQGVVQVVDWLWQYAFDQRASDIHLEPRREQGVIRFRIDGVLHPVYQMPMGVMNAMTRASSCWAAWTWWKSAARRTAASRPATRAATRLKCACPPCPRPLAKRW
jgi:general secretion pathway protein E